MRLAKNSFLVIIFTIISFSSMAYSQQGDLSPLGFEFGINKKEAKKVIDSKGKRIVLDEEDSKEMIVIVMQGVIVNLPIDVSGKDVMTELEFYKKKLLATSLIFAATDENEKAAIESDFVQYFTSKYGKPVERETVMHFTTTSWDIPEVKLVMFTDNKDNTVKIQYKHKPGPMAGFVFILLRSNINTNPAIGPNLKTSWMIKEGLLKPIPQPRCFLKVIIASPQDMMSSTGLNKYNNPVSFMAQISHSSHKTQLNMA